MLELSQDQSHAIYHLLEWYRDKSRLKSITLGGYAGTGKTTLISVFRNELSKVHKGIKVAFCAYTGKAARVLETKLKDLKAVYPADTVGTIHSLIYSPKINNKEEIIGWELKGDLDYNLIILDEASMVDENIWNDLLSFNIPILAVGDHAQLPPIQGNFNLMSEPFLKLTEIHRQAKENPIIQMSIFAREQGAIPAGHYGINIEKYEKGDFDARDKVNELLMNYNSETLILCGYNNTRIRLNNYIRQSMDLFRPVPECGERVICLRNNHAKKVYNGMRGNISDIEIIDDDWLRCEIEMDNEAVLYKGLVYAKQFNNPETLNYKSLLAPPSIRGRCASSYNTTYYTSARAVLAKGDLFDFGYALTVHKAQGSQARRVVLFEERFKQMSDDDWKRWLYTAVTRAESELFIIPPN